MFRDKSKAGERGKSRKEILEDFRLRRRFRGEQNFAPVCGIIAAHKFTKSGIFMVNAVFEYFLPAVYDKCRFKVIFFRHEH